MVVSHDDSYFHLADRCVRLEDGKISEIPARKYLVKMLSTVLNWKRRGLGAFETKQFAGPPQKMLASG